jgi:MFS family permease
VAARAEAPPRADRSRTARADVRAVLAVPALRAIMFGTAIASGSLSGIGFWAPSFFERHTSLREDQASGIVGVLILVGAIGGTLLGGRLVDRLTARGGAGSPALRIAACTQAAGGAALLVVFLPVPLPVRIVASLVGVAGVVAGFPALNATTASLVPGALRGMAFSTVGFLTALAGAISPLLIGAIADRFEFVVDGEVKGHLAYAFLIVLPLLFVGAGILWRGRHLVVPDSAPGPAGADPAPDLGG